MAPRTRRTSAARAHRRSWGPRLAAWWQPRRAWLQQHRRSILFGLLVVLVVMLAAWGVHYALPQVSRVVACGSPPTLQVTLTYPAYLAVGDQGLLTLTATNLGRQPVSGSLVVAFDAPPAGAAAVQLAPDTGSTLRFERLPPGASQAGRVRFTRSEPLSLPVLLGRQPRPLRFALLWEGQPCGGQKEAIAPAPYRLRALLGWLSGLVGLGLSGLFDALWRRLQRWIQGEKAP